MKIKSIIKRPITGKFYDLTVAHNHNFLANNILVHNCNTSAQNAVIVGVHRGINEVDELDIIQEAGRAGRFGKAPVGNVFLICDNVSTWKERIHNPRHVTSTLLNVHALAFHLCAEIKNRVITDYTSLYTWYNRTLASIQKPLTPEMIDDVLRQLEAWYAIKIEGDQLDITPLGKVAATLYFHPEDVHHWYTCFKHINQHNLWHEDLCMAYALAAPNYQLPYIQRNEMETVQEYFNSLRPKWGRGPMLKQSTLARDVYNQIVGHETNTYSPTLKTFQYDAERIISAINWACGIAHIPKYDALMILPLRLKYGVSQELIQLVQLPGIGKVRAKKLSAMGITTWEDVIKHPTKVQQAVGAKNIQNVLRNARMLLRKNNEEETV